MLVIRLARTGRKKYPTYRLVAADSRRPTTGKFVSLLGHYNPHTKEFSLKKDEVQQYLKNGAQPSDAVIKLLQQEKLDLPEWVQPKVRPERKPKKEPIAKPEPKAEAPAESKEVPEAADEGEERVAQAAADNAAEVTDEAQESAELTETAADNEQQAAASAEASKAAAEAATGPKDEKEPQAS
jgi:small subunit ribosomal protein S16